MKNFLLLLSAIGCMTISAANAADATQKNRIFSPESFWYKPIPATATLHPNSANYVQEFLRQKKTYYGTVNINLTSYTSPVWYSNWYTQKVNVKEWDCQGKGFVDSALKLAWTNVPIPLWAIPAKGSDAEMSVYDAATDTLWEFWRMRKTTAGTWEACWGGRIQGARSNQGTFNTYYGTTATSLPFIGGQIMAEELAAGEIKHALGISLVDIEKKTIFSWPAQRSDGVNPYNVPHRIPEGARFRLDPTVNVDALPMSKAGKIIAKAAQQYGFVVWDRAGAISLRAQNTYSYTQLGRPNPYPALFESKPAYAVLNGFPWDKLQFMPMHYKAE
ncbi:MAG: DUF4124 domain-containing protein [Methylotenera sp.]|nr:MAG: DUF4124 domain-containing protein [Methylotenera sp.]